jgi:hypothetical protein
MKVQRVVRDALGQVDADDRNELPRQLGLTFEVVVVLRLVGCPLAARKT